jgi:hypothetical protein
VSYSSLKLAEARKKLLCQQPNENAFFGFFGFFAAIFSFVTLCFGCPPVIKEKMALKFGKKIRKMRCLPSQSTQLSNSLALAASVCVFVSRA